MSANPTSAAPSETNRLVARLVDAAVAVIRANAEMLGDLDRAVGDGDHGVNMLRGFTAIDEVRGSIGALPLPSALDAMGRVLVMKVGGASGPLYGSLLIAMGRAAARDAAHASLREMLEEGIAAVKKRGKSDRGEKTMLDVLVPVQLAWERACSEGLALREALERLKRAAEEGLAETRPLIATKGRASFLRERSIGHLDPGACSSCLLVRAACDAFLEPTKP
jgi:phosphoenolpyruvate---glycerone phosphotransferase subunit DhaL